MAGNRKDWCETLSIPPRTDLPGWDRIRAGDLARKIAEQQDGGELCMIPACNFAFIDEGREQAEYLRPDEEIESTRGRPATSVSFV